MAAIWYVICIIFSYSAIVCRINNNNRNESICSPAGCRRQSHAEFTRVHTHQRSNRGGRRGVDNRSLHVLCRALSGYKCDHARQKRTVSSQNFVIRSHVHMTRRRRDTYYVSIMSISAHTHTRSFNNNNNKYLRE